MDRRIGRATLTDGRAGLRVDGRDIGSVEVAASGAARRRGLLGRDGIEAAILLTPAASVHTVGMRFPIDVAFLDRRLVVRDVVTMRPGRLGWPRLRARHILETEAGACARWGIRPGARVEITPAPPILSR
jgi:uncharacterized membrane protein (UPF0127 family)